MKILFYLLILNRKKPVSALYAPNNKSKINTEKSKFYDLLDFVL